MDVRVILALLIGNALLACSCQGEPDRAAIAAGRVKPLLECDLKAIGVTYPPKRLLLRAFKTEKRLDVWVGNGTGKLKKFKSYPIVAMSGKTGPKRKEGDRQVPEGIYQIDRFNPKSQFHLSLGISYPNAADKLFADRESPGSDIFIHGSNKSIGCLAMGDPAIEEIYTLARSVSGPISVHIFPWQFTSNETVDTPLWQQLRTIDLDFQLKPRIQKIRVSKVGAYELVSR